LTRASVARFDVQFVRDDRVFVRREPRELVHAAREQAPRERVEREGRVRPALDRDRACTYVDRDDGVARRAGMI
jgi:hypothetical protein